MKINQRPGRVLPPVYRKAIELGFQRPLTLKERLQIAAGYNLLVSLTVATEHSPGRFLPGLVITTSPVLDVSRREGRWRRALTWAFGFRQQDAAGAIITTDGAWQRLKLRFWQASNIFRRDRA